MLKTDAKKLGLIALISNLGTNELTPEQKASLTFYVVNEKFSDGLPEAIRYFAESSLAIGEAEANLKNAQKSLELCRKKLEASLREIDKVLKEEGEKAGEWPLLSRRTIDEVFS